MRQVDSIPYVKKSIPLAHKHDKLITALRRCALFLEDGTMEPSHVLSVISEFVEEAIQEVDI